MFLFRTQLYVVFLHYLFYYFIHDHYVVFFLLISARGLDIPSIRTVVNYDVARDIDTHTHRIGRTGRAGEKGVAYTLLTNKDTSFAGDLVRNLEGANQSVRKELMDLAMQVRHQ